MANGPTNGRAWLLTLLGGVLLLVAAGLGGIAKGQWEQVDANTAAIAVQAAHFEALRATVDRIDKNVAKLVEKEP